MGGFPDVAPMRARAIAVALVLVVAACGGDGDDAADPSVEIADLSSTLVHDLTPLRDSDVPELPFDDNPDPTRCGIPLQWGDRGPAWLTGMWEGQLIQPDVLLYDSHQRLHIVGQGSHGAEVRIVLYQENPVLDFYMVEVVGGSGDEGWVPAPFVSFDPIGA